MKLTLKLRLISDATFGRGDGVSGLVDQEIEYDAATGLPFVRGRTLKGLLAEECANILHTVPGLENSAKHLFGIGGSSLGGAGALRVGNAQMPADLRQAVQADIVAGRCTPAEVLEMFTAVRRQTAVDEATGTPEDHSLRSSRVLLRGTELAAELELAEENDDALALLCACVAGLRRGGSGRNRGRGRLEAELEHVDSAAFLDYFEQLARGQTA